MSYVKLLLEEDYEIRSHRNDVQAICPKCIPTKIEALIYKLINNLLQEKNLDTKESISCINFDELWDMKAKSFMPIRKPAVAPDLVKSKHEKIDEEVLLYIQRNHAASDLTLNQKHFGKRFSLPLNLSTEENLACKSLKFVSQSHLSAVNRNHHYATSDLMLCQTAIDKRLSLPVNLDKSVNPPPLCSYPCINDLSICEPTKLIKTERSNYIDSQVSEEFIVDKATEDIQEEVATCLSLQKSVKRGLFYKTFKRVRHILRRMEKCISQIL